MHTHDQLHVRLQRMLLIQYLDWCCSFLLYCKLQQLELFLWIHGNVIKVTTSIHSTSSQIDVCLPRSPLLQVLPSWAQRSTLYTCKHNTITYVCIHAYTYVRICIYNLHNIMYIYMYNSQLIYVTSINITLIHVHIHIHNYDNHCMHKLIIKLCIIKISYTYINIWKFVKQANSQYNVKVLTLHKFKIVHIYI